ncbi:NADH:flavin oxidoreductase [Domibacillus epiphyticus]
MKDTILFSPVTLGTIDFGNRAGVAPMTRTSAAYEGLATDQMVSYYEKFARGGFGFIITEGIYPDDKYSQGYMNQPGIVNDDQVQSWRKVVEAVHQQGSKIIAQLMHAGALSQGNRFVKEAMGPSAVKPKGEQLGIYGGEGAFPTPKEAAKQDIADVIAGFVKAAQRAKEAGFDGIEIHGANGYILDQFLTDYMNQRTDEYGGSTENRVRLAVEVVKAVREAVGPDFTVGIRISQGKVNDHTHKWAGKEKDAEIIFGQLGRSGVDFIHVTEYKAWEPAFSEGQGASLAALAKKFGNVPVIANGHLEDPEQASAIIEKGEADAVTIGRGALANSDWAIKVQKGEKLEEFDPEKILSPDAKIKDFEA